MSKRLNTGCDACPSRTHCLDAYTDGAVHCGAYVGAAEMFNKVIEAAQPSVWANAKDGKACHVEHFNSRHEGLAYISEMMNDLEHTYRDLQSWYANLKNEVYAYDPDSSDGHVNDIYYTAKELCQEANAIREQCEKWFVSFESHTGTDNEA